MQRKQAIHNSGAWGINGLGFLSRLAINFLHQLVRLNIDIASFYRFYMRYLFPALMGVIDFVVVGLVALFFSRLFRRRNSSRRLASFSYLWLFILLVGVGMIAIGGAVYGDHLIELGSSLVCLGVFSGFSKLLKKKSDDSPV
ncbi:hypothetical protein [Paucibacter sp. KCTC 42545]|uniref:hypothetical protein n=1 Tax=Paucibacter sp. KCTC 42545 TaxID=1768242 RepID=UPI001E515EC9|nr:hypothetical protein [Paucibacter sp. KCTC 42545]